jgi:hypothetical protein
MEAPKEKGPGPDGFIGIFFSHCWDIIKIDLINAVNQFYCRNQQGLQFLNQAYVILIPKKDNPKLVSDFRPISLTHNFAKLISKLLANRLAPELEDLISVNQSAFIKKCCIHDNFMYVQEVIKELHKKKYHPCLLSWIFSKVLIQLIGLTCSTLWNNLDSLRDGEIELLPCGAQLLLHFWSMVCLARRCFSAEV